MNTSQLLTVGGMCVDLIIEFEGDGRFSQHEQLVPSTTWTMGSCSAITARGALVSVRGDDVFGRFS